MDIIIATTTATSTIYRLTDEALNLINFNYQFWTFIVCVFIGFCVIYLVLNIFN
jgi:hypothetical protein